MARKLRQGEGRKNEIIRIEHLLGSSPHTPISQIRTKRLRDVQSPPGGQRCLAAELSYILSMTPHRERLSAALPHSACHHSPVSKAQVLGVPGQSKKAGRWGAVPLRPQGPLYFSFLFPHFPLFFTLGPSQGPDTRRSPWWWRVALKNSEKAVLGCWMADLRECFHPVPCSQRPHLSSVMQDRAASGTGHNPRLLSSSLLIWMRERPGHRQTSGSLVSSETGRGGRRITGG